MSKQHIDEINCSPAETETVSMSIGKIEENAQITVKDTGWSEEEKERMKQFGYDGLDMVRAWYSWPAKKADSPGRHGFLQRGIFP